MKKVTSLLCLLLVFTLVLAPLCYAEENSDTLSDWNIKIVVPEGKTSVLKGSSYYIYAKKTGTIPYVMLTTYRYDSEERFIEDFTAYMAKQYEDLTVTSEAERKTIGDKSCWEIDYGYTVSGYEVKDRRIVMIVNGMTYLFASKEIESRGDTVDGMLEQIVAGCVFLDEDGNELPGLEEGYTLYPAYVYREWDGKPKYWLDISSARLGDLELHCNFRSEGEAFYETVYLLGMDSVQIDGNVMRFTEVHDRFGNDYTPMFPEITIRIAADGVVMTVVRDEKTLAGGGENNLFGGEYEMSPLRLGRAYEYYQDDGMLKYWIDSDGQDYLLHAMFRSGDPTWYEQVFTLDAASAEAEGDYVLKIHKVFNQNGEDVSAWFKSFTLSWVQGAIMLNVSCDESTLAGGAEDNILTGVYMLEPRSFLLPLENGPYTPDELGEWAQNYYFTHEHFYPQEANVEKNADGTFTIQLFENIAVDSDTRTVIFARYNVDAYGRGTNVETDEQIDLFR